jgi:hypothetical protein
MVLTGAPASAHAHGGRLMLALWGPFRDPVPRCQRIIGAAAAFYTRHAVAVRNQCALDQLEGRICDVLAMEEAISAARVIALDRIDRHCTEREVGQLQFLSLLEVQADVTNACQQLQDEFISTVYAPVAGDAAGVPGATPACVAATAEVGMRLLRIAARFWRRSFDRIAATDLTPSAKRRLVDHAVARIDRATAVAAERLSSRCAPAVFQRVYQQPPATFLANLVWKARCLVGESYVQDAVYCDWQP